MTIVTVVLVVYNCNELQSIHVCDGVCGEMMFLI